MIRRERWTLLCCILSSLNDVAVYSQCMCEGARCSSTSAELFTEISNELSNTATAKNQLINTLLTVAASKGVLPELALALQPTLEDVATSPSSKSINMMPFTGNLQSAGQDYFSANYMPGSTQSSPYQEYLQLYPSTPENMQGLQQPTTGLPLESYCCGSELPSSHANQLEYANQVYKYFSSVPISQLDKTQLENFKNTYMPILNLDNVERPSISNQPVVVTSESDYIPPFNIEINVPLPQIPEQLLALLSNDQTVKDTTVNANPGQPGDIPMPIVISKAKSKSSLKKVLPIMLLAMLLDDSEGCSGSCRCDSESNFIPIPYPIPIPINNPVIYKSKYNSAENESSEENIP